MYLSLVNDRNPPIGTFKVFLTRKWACTIAPAVSEMSQKK